MAIPEASIRPRQMADLPALADRLALVAAADGYPGRFPQDPVDWLRSRDLLGAWVAEQEGDPVGQVVLRRPGSGRLCLPRPGKRPPSSGCSHCSMW